MPSLTLKKNDLDKLGPTLPVHVGCGSITEAVWQKTGVTVPAPVPVLAMIDTGAAATIIKEETIMRLKVPPVDEVLIKTPTASGVVCRRYWLRLFLDQDVYIETTVIAASLEGQHIQCLIGRDALRHCLVIYNGPDNSYTLGF